MVRALLDIVAELLLLGGELLLEHLVCAPDRLLLEQPVDLLQRNTTCLRDKEEGEEECQEGQGGEEEVDTVVHRPEHLLGKARDEEVEKPVTGSGGGLGQGTEVRVEELLLVLLEGNQNDRR